MQRITAVLAVVLGLGLIGFTLATSLYSRTAAAERITDTFRSAMSPAGVASTRADYDTIARGRTQFTRDLVPALARDLKLSAPQFNAFVGSNFPAVPAAVATFPRINSFVGPYITTLERNREEFDDADSLPLLGLPLDATPWLIAGLGAAIALAGGLALLTGSRAATLAILALGAVAVAVPLAASIPGKASDARRITVIGGQVLDRRAAAFAETTTAKVDALVTEVTTKMVPALATRLGTTPGAFGATLARDYPATSNLLRVWPARLSQKAHGIAAGMQAYAGDWKKADKIPLKSLAWVVVGPGIALALVAAFSFLARRRAPVTPG